MRDPKVLARVGALAAAAAPRATAFVERFVDYCQ
jgi:hypothetical protein